MLGEYGILLNFHGLLKELGKFPNALVNFLHTSNGQLAAVVLAAVVVLLLFRRNRG